MVVMMMMMKKKLLVMVIIISGPQRVCAEVKSCGSSEYVMGRGRAEETVAQNFGGPGWALISF